MTWTTPRTWVTDEIVTRAKFEPELYANALELLPAKAVAAGDLFYRAPGAIMERIPIGATGAYFRGPAPGWSMSPGGPISSLVSNPVGDNQVTLGVDNVMTAITFSGGSSILPVTIPPSGQILVRFSAYASVGGALVHWAVMEDFGGGTVIEQPGTRVRVSSGAAAQEARFEVSVLMTAYTAGTSHNLRWGHMRGTGGTAQILYGDNGTDVARGPAVMEAWAVG